MVWNGSSEKEAGCFENKINAAFNIIGKSLRFKLKIYSLLLIVFVVSINAQTLRNQIDLKLSDSTYSLYSLKSMNSDYLRSEYKNYHSAFNVAGQIIVGSSLAFIFPISFLYGSFLASFHHEPDDAVKVGLLFLMFSSYTFGAAVGVDWIASIENKNNSLLETFGYSAIGSGAGILLISILASQYETIPWCGGFVAFLCPILSSVLYTTLISDWPAQAEISSDRIEPDRIYGHRDLIEESMLIKINIFQLRF